MLRLLCMGLPALLAGCVVVVVPEHAQLPPTISSAQVTVHLPENPVTPTPPPQVTERVVVREVQGKCRIDVPPTAPRLPVVPARTEGSLLGYKEVEDILVEHIFALREAIQLYRADIDQYYLNMRERCNTQ